MELRGGEMSSGEGESHVLHQAGHSFDPFIPSAYSLNKGVLSIHHIPSTTLGTSDIVVTEKSKPPSLRNVVQWSLV